MTVYRFIGDVHGKFKQYKNIIKDVEVSRQVGDFGVGFMKWDYHENEKVFTTNPPYDHIMKGDHKFIRGNHDNPIVCQQQSYWIPDGTIEVVNGVKLMYVGGGISIDKDWRTEGFDYWADEELSYHKLQGIIDLYDVEKPDIMVSHEIPEEITKVIEIVSGRQKLNIDSRTRDAFQTMFENHQPKLWIHGHWHCTYRKEVNGTLFIGLNELEYLDINIG